MEERTKLDKVSKQTHALLAYAKIMESIVMQNQTVTVSNILCTLFLIKY